MDQQATQPMPYGNQPYDSQLPARTGGDDDATLSLGQRALYVVGGLALAAAGARPRPNPLLNILALGAGSYLAWRGAEGSCPIKAAYVRRFG
ncbi:hypothetical protein MVG78_18345 [Roseomonas gilardii subsp. gilardii]|uniref:hypothetical protein n=1 Tax=Roseomonas gilardii TaxID=257708 RepID=UPI001FF8E734|nr:hypothetical protein [Roseomonas gilardii]UPG72427.1 hypothetical protein MVG78_18345 [Roseomonas gilardii subsp. gilardii]